MITAVVAAEATTEPRMLATSMVRGVAPSQWPILYWVTSEPLMERAVQTTPPMSRVCSMPLGPERPSAESATAVTMSVVSVIPEMGVMEMRAMAHAETAAKRKATPSVSRVATSARAVARGSAASTEKRK
jgi:hypothetical protein